MNTVRIKCPKCSVLLEVRNSKNEAVKSIKCPKCGSFLQIRFRVEQKEEKPIPVEANNDDTSVETMLPTEVNSKAMLVCDDLQYVLNVGMNVVGRQSSKSTANIQIQSGDVYMSRSHAIINVVKTMSGKLKCIISNGNNKNPILINGILLGKTDEVILSDDDKIKMGNTIVKFVLV